MKKKIAILTLSLTTNYGGILQAFALQKTLNDLGHNAITINRKGLVYSDFKIFLLKLKKSLLKHHKALLLTSKQNKIISRHTHEFIEKNILMSKFMNKGEDLKLFFDNEKFDSVVVGSDQVWRPKYTPNIYNSFFDFIKDDLKINKISYAASYGTDKWEFSTDESKICKDLVGKFSAVSVREKSGVELCKKHFEVEAAHVLDPTFLIEKEDYIKLFRDTSVSNSGQLYTYILDREEEKEKIIKRISQERKIKEFYFQPNPHIHDVKSLDDLEALVYPPVEDWIKGFHDADYVVTDSFHGTVFSIIFNKNFIAIGNKERGLSRFQSILKLFDLENRLVFNEMDVTDELLSESIDFHKVNLKLKQLKEESIAFLKDNL